MNKLYIVKTGTTFPAIAERLGDFDRWTAHALAPLDVETTVVDAEHGESPPGPDRCAGAVITGSHAMVTDDLPWSVRLEGWIRSLLVSRTPLFGICYGHQLLARAAGGHVGYHRRGMEVGTVGVHRLPESADDPLFGLLPQSFRVHATHAQTVLSLPEGAVRLAANAYEPNHAFRVGNCAWGVQFHPEYSADIMRAYVTAEAAEIGSAGMNAEAILTAVEETPFAARVLSSFGQLVEERLRAESSACRSAGNRLRAPAGGGRRQERECLS